MWATLVNQSSAELKFDGSDEKGNRISAGVTLNKDEPQEVTDAMASHIEGVVKDGRFDIVVTKSKPGPKPVVEAWPPADSPRKAKTGA